MTLVGSMTDGRYEGEGEKMKLISSVRVWIAVTDLTGQFEAE